MKIGVIVSGTKSEIPIWQSYLIEQLMCVDDFEVIIISKKITGAESYYSRLLALHLKLESKTISNNIERPQLNGVEIDEKVDKSCNVYINLTQDSKVGLNHELSTVWEIRYNGKNISEQSGIGVIETTKKKPQIQIDLVCTEGNKTFTLDIAKFNVHWSTVWNTSQVLYSLPQFLIKKLHNQNKQQYIELYEPEHSVISLSVSLKYILSAYTSVFKKYKDQISNKLFKTNSQEWEVFLGEGNCLNNDFEELISFDIPKNEFWADPFLFQHKEELYLFFERFPFTTQKGIISCALIKEGKAINVMDVLEKPYHLSFPFIFEEDGDIYMMPECSANKRIELYRCVTFPNKWELYSTALEGESVADTIYHRDKNGDRWLFTSKTNPAVVNHCNELHIYKVDSLGFKKVEPHKENPIIIDSELARNGGSIFENEDKFYRVAQDNTYGFYGRGVSINEIEVLSLDAYQERTIKKITPSFHNKLIGLHQLHQVNGYFVIDSRLK